MQILFIGAGAQMAQPAVKILSECERVERLILADIDIRNLPKVRMWNGKLAERIFLDVRDIDALKRHMHSATLVVNTSGPYYLFGRNIVESAIDCECDYVDICDDWEPTLDILALNNRARAKGVTVLIGAGASPGISNLLARKAADQLERVERLFTGWTFDSGTEVGIKEIQNIINSDRVPAALTHLMQQISGKIRVWQNGELSDVKPLQKKSLGYCGIGEGIGWSVGHPEAVTLPKQYPQLKECANVIVHPGHSIWLLKIVSSLIDMRLVSVNFAARVAQLTLKALWPFIKNGEPAQLNDKEKTPLAVFALAEGNAGGVKKRVVIELKMRSNFDMATLTSVPLGTFAEFMLSESTMKRGVITPEELTVDDSFFEILSSRLTNSQEEATSLFSQTIENL